MQGPLAQLLSLACHVNHACASHEVARFLPDNSTCVFCDRIVFSRLRPNPPAVPILEVCGDTPETWMQWLLNEGCLGARVHWADRDGSGRTTAGFVGGGGGWALETLLEGGHSAFWFADWNVWNHEAVAQRIWRVSYTAGALRQTDLTHGMSVDAAASELQQALASILAFSEQQQCDPFTGIFREALAASKDGNVNANVGDLAPAGVLSARERRLVQVCQQASVFGGMGSWNDMGFDSPVQETYEAVSARLFAAISGALPAAVNGWVHRRLNAVTRSE